MFSKEIFKKLRQDQAEVISSNILIEIKRAGKLYMWNCQYWHGYCDALDTTGELWQLVYEKVQNNIK
jgi:hypothetical protein